MGLFHWLAEQFSADTAVVSKPGGGIQNDSAIGFSAAPGGFTGNALSAGIDPGSSLIGIDIDNEWSSGLGEMNLVNPSNGLPSLDGYSAVDIAGNAFGTDFTGMGFGNDS